MSNTGLLQGCIDACRPPYVEIAGPSPGGYSFLLELGVHLPDGVIVTNIDNPVTLHPFGDNPTMHAVDAVVDAQHMPYSSRSIGTILANSLPLYAHHDATLRQHALDEYGRVGTAELSPAAVYNLHIALLLESSRVLRTGGLLIIENILSQDTAAARALGFETLLGEKEEARFSSQIYRLTNK